MGKATGNHPTRKGPKRNMRYSQFFQRCLSGGDSLGPPGEQNTTEEEEHPAETEGSQKRAYDRTILKPFGGVGPDEPKGEAEMDLRMRRGERQAGRMIRVGTWNVRTLSKGQLENVKREMVRNRVNVMGLSEVRWIGSGVMESEEVKCINREVKKDREERQWCWTKKWQEE